MSKLLLPTRTIFKFILEDLNNKMVFLGGPRQVGKTTLAQQCLHNYYDEHPAYLNWDFKEHRDIIRNRAWPKTEKLIIFDEIHKLKGWQRLVKGYYDVLKNIHSFLITGSARLDLYRKGGDSLMGRYQYYRLHPYSLPELGITTENFSNLLIYGGFPEPLVQKNTKSLQRWHQNRLDKLIRSDIRDLENIKDINKLELLTEDLANRIGSPLSLARIAKDLEADSKTIGNWIEILSNLYYCFQLSPYGEREIKTAVKKEKKLYLWDWSQIKVEGIRFENLVASHLLKFCHYLEDTEGHKMELRYLRDINGREIDFVVVKNRSPLFAVECKLTDLELSKHVTYFKDRITKIPKFYQVHTGSTERQIDEKISIVPFDKFCLYENLV